ncbi:MAG: LLM class flavin-dependent oxidoreductase [Sphingobium sp.]
MSDGNAHTNPIFNSNGLKLGTFCTNTVSAITKAPELTEPTWKNMLAAARLADGFGFEAITPIARWKGYLDGAPDHKSNEIFEAFTFAAAVSQVTTHSAVFATSHAPTLHPMAIAKMASSIDHMSGGRFALNVVGGWNRREFDMFGIDLLDHDERYAYLEDWLSVLRRLWSGEEFDYQSPYFKMKGALAHPTPVQAKIPIMNAATSLTGMRFAARNSDIGFCTPRGDDPRAWKDEIAQYKALALNEFGRKIQIWTNATVVLRDTVAEAQDYFNYFTGEAIDRPAIDSLMNTMIRENGLDPSDPKVAFMRKRMSGGAGYPLLGDAQSIAEQLRQMAEAGIDGVMLSWVDYIDGIDSFGRKVLPLLEDFGLRGAKS